MTKLHLYIEINEGETVEQAIERTDNIIDSLFSEHGYSILEQDQNEDIENEIKTFLSVDITKSKAHNILNDYMYQVY